MRGTARRFSTTLRRKVGLSYLLHHPEPAGRARERSPLVLFLHGMGERGDELSLVAKHGPPVLAEAGRDSWTRAYADPKLYEWMLAQRSPGFHL